LQSLEELENCLSGKHDCGSSDRLVELLAKGGRLEAAGTGTQGDLKVLQGLDREPNQMHRH